MSEILLLEQQIDQLLGTFLFWFALLMVGLVSTIILGYLWVERTDVHVASIFLIFIPVVVMMVLFHPFSEENKEQVNILKEEIQDIKRDYYIAFSCDILRENIVTQLRNGNSTWLDFQQDYYYHNCEIPLRDEVLKLQ